MDILYEDARILVCIKPAGVVSAGDDEGGMVDLLRKELSDEHACVRSVHRLDAQVSGLMVFARSQAAASILSEQVRTREFEKEYLAAAHGRFKESAGQMEDLLWYNRSLRKSRVMQETGRDVKRALLSSASKKVALVDSSKFLSRGIYTYCSFRELDTLITVRTEENAPVLDEIAKQGVEIIAAADAGGDAAGGHGVPERPAKRLV